MTRAMLHQFENSLNFLSGLKLIDFKYIPKLCLEEDFKKLVEHYLKKLVEPITYKKLNNIDIHEYMNHFELLLESIISAGQLALEENSLTSVRRDLAFSWLQTWLNRNLEVNPNRKLKDMQKLLSDMLANEEVKKFIQDIVWKEYFKAQQILDLASSSAIKESTNSHFVQVQSDPLKRAFFLVFVALFNYINHQEYLLSKGERKKDYSSDMDGHDESPKEDPIHRLWMQQRGLPVPG